LQDGTSWAVGGMCPGRWGLGKPWEMMLKNFPSFQDIGWASFWVILDGSGGELVYCLFRLDWASLYMSFWTMVLVLCHLGLGSVRGPTGLVGGFSAEPGVWLQGSSSIKMPHRAGGRPGDKERDWSGRRL